MQLLPRPAWGQPTPGGRVVAAPPPPALRTNLTRAQQHGRLYRTTTTTTTTHSSSSSRQPLAEPPAFGAPARQPTPEEVVCIVRGAALTPEQQTAQRLQLPLTQRVRLPPGSPSPRQLMAQLQAAGSWQELEAIVSRHQQQRAALPPPEQQQQQPQQTAAPTIQQQQPLPPPPSKQRRKQPVRALELPGSSSSGGGDGGGGAQALTTGSSADAAGAAPAAQPPQPLGLEQQFNALHVTEAFRRLPGLLPASPQQLQQPARQRVAALIAHLGRLAEQQCRAGELDARGLAHVALALSKLGHVDAGCVGELQAAALLRAHEFSSRHAAMLLLALVNLRVRPQAELLAALQQHMLATQHLYDQQSLATTIWSLAKLGAQQPPAAAAGANGSETSSSSSSSSSSNPQQLRRQLVAALLARCDPQMLHWQGRWLAQSAWGFAKLGVQPSSAWGQTFLAAAASQLPHMNMQDLANVVSALPRLGVLPDAAWLDAWAATTTKKLHTAQPLGVYSVLLGVSRLKQAQRRAAARATKQQHAAEAPHSQAAAGGSAATTPTSSSRCPVSLAELRLLRAAVLWVVKHPGSLNRGQLSGVIAALSELLPRLAPAPAQGGGEAHATAAEPVVEGQHSSEEGRHKWQQVQQHLLGMLLPLLPLWAGCVEGMAQSAGSRRQGRLVRLAWQRLVWLCSWAPSPSEGNGDSGVEQLQPGPTRSSDGPV